MSERLALRAVEHEQSIPLPERGSIILGSSSDRADVVVEGEGVDPAHCAIGRLAGGGWAIKDLGSPVGIAINTKRVRTARLRAGQRLALGAAEFRVEDAANEVGSDRRSARDQPTRVGGYRIEKPLGRGGMGDVFLAVQESLERPVALKILHKRLASDAEFVRRFQVEARAAAALNHPNVVHVYDVGEADGHHYLSMEYMERGNVEERLARGGPLPVESTLDILCAAARGLVYAEERELLHCDIKPANLMLSESGEAKIGDLGLAREHTDRSSDRVFGTPHFISPEQARGEALDARSDLYSLGATGFQLLAGRTPFDGANAREIVRARFEAPAPRLDQVATVPSGVADLIADCLERDRDRRPASASVVLARLEQERRALASGSASATSPGGKLRLAALSVVLISVLGATAYFLRPTESAFDDASSGGASTVALGRTPLELETPPATAMPSLEPNSSVEPKSESPDSDAELRQFELDAMAAYGSIALDRDASPRARTEALRAVAQKFSGTDAAAQAAREAEGLAAKLAEREREERKRDSQLSELTAALDALVAPFEEPLRPAAALTALRQYRPDPRLAGDARWEAAVRDLEERVVARAAERVTAAWKSVDKRLLEGAFDEARAELTALRAALDDSALAEANAVEQAPTSATGDAQSAEPPEPRELPTGWSELIAERSRVADRIAQLPELRVAFEQDLTRGDALRFAALFRDGGKFGDALQRMDFPAALASLENAEVELSTNEFRERLAELRAWVESAASAPQILVEAFAQGRWRRMRVPDSRGRRANRDVAALDATSFRLRTKTDAVDTIAWSEYWSDAASLRQIFVGRLNDGYTDAQARSIADLLSLSGVLAAANIARPLLVSSGRPPLGEDTLATLRASMQPALEWEVVTERTRRESAVVVALAGVLDSAYRADWLVATTATERLLKDSPASLLLRMLSDGSAPGLFQSTPAKQVPSAPSDD